MNNSPRGARDMTQGSTTKHILYFSLPLLAGSFLQQLYNMVDSWVVGNYAGDAALAAVGIGFPVLFMFSSLFMGLSNGGTVVIAQFFGAGQMDRVRDAVDTIYTAFMAAAIPLTAGAMLLVTPMLWLLRAEQAGCFHEAWLYLIIVCAGIVGTIGYNLNAGILNGLGNSRTTLLFLAIAAILNIILDLVLVLLCGLGVAGVALGTIVSQAFSWLFGLWYINGHYPEVAIHPFCRRFDKALFRQIMNIGLPAGFQMSLVSLGAIVVLSKVNTFGKQFTAGFNVGNKLDALAFLPVQSLASGVTAFVGQNVGAGKLDRVYQGVRVTLVSSVVWSAAVAVLLYFWSEPLMSLFSPTPAVIEAGSLYLRCIMPPYVLFAIMFCLSAAMRGAGDSWFPMMVTVASMILLRVPGVYLLANYFGAAYMFYGYGIGWVVGLVLSVAHYLSGRWLRKGSLAATPAAVQPESESE